jgi:hypothetical protein
MPWVILPWLALVEFFGLTAKEYDEHDDNKATMLMMTATMATATAATPTTRIAATVATMTKVTWTAIALVTMTTTTMTSTMSTMMGQQQCDDDGDYGTKTI